MSIQQEFNSVQENIYERWFRGGIGPVQLRRQKLSDQESQEQTLAARRILGSVRALLPDIRSDNPLPSAGKGLRLRLSIPGV